MSQDRWTQVELRQGNSYRVCWVDKEVKQGDVVSLKGFDDDWRVLYVYCTKDRSEINRGWHNDI